MANFHYFKLDDRSERDQPLIFSCNLQGLADSIDSPPSKRTPKIYWLAQGDLQTRE